MLTFGIVLLTGNVFAQVTTNSPNVPPQNGQYVSPTQYHATYGTAAFVDNGTHRDFLTSHAPPPQVGGTTTHSFGSSISATYHPQNGPPMNVTAPAQVTTNVTKTGGANPNAGTYSNEMVQLDILNGTLPPGVMIRESPTLQSTGQTTITDIGGGQYQIDSFFDIFTELSMDGGQNWIPTTSGPVHMALNPLGGGTVIPTMSQWGLIIFGLLMLLVIVKFVRKS